MRDAVAARYFWCLLIALFLTSGTKHVLTFATGPTVLKNDAHEYWSRGGRVAEGDWLQVDDAVNYRGPLYPTFLGLCRWAFGSQALLGVAVLQHLLHMVTGLMTAAISWVITRRRLVVLAAYGMSVLCVTRPWYANVVLTESMFLFLMTATFGALVVYHRRPSTPAAAIFAVLLGLSILTRPIPKLLWLPLVTLFFLHVSQWADLRRILRHAVVAGLALWGVLAPWSIRNRLIFENASVARVPPINKWVVCFHDQSAADLPIPDTAAGDRLRALLPEIDSDNTLRRDGYEVIRRLQDTGLSEEEVDDLITAACLDAIEEHPRTFGWKAVKRFVNFWRCSVKKYPFYSTYRCDRTCDFEGQVTWRFEPFASWYEQVLLRCPSGRLRWMELDSLACGLGTLLLIIRRRTRTIGLSLATIFLYFAAVTAALEVENYRYRMVLDPCIIVASVCGLMSRREIIDTESAGL
jgi:hypothetical protein